MSDEKGIDVEQSSRDEALGSGTESGAEPKLSPGSEVDARGLRQPEILLNMSDEERAALEKRLVRKIDLRLLPMLVVMYILNYIDR